MKTHECPNGMKFVCLDDEEREKLGFGSICCRCDQEVLGKMQYVPVLHDMACQNCAVEMSKYHMTTSDLTIQEDNIRNLKRRMRS